MAFIVPALVAVLSGVGYTRSAWVSEVGALVGFAALPILLSGVVMDVARRVVWPMKRAVLALSRAS